MVWISPLTSLPMSEYFRMIDVASPTTTCQVAWTVVSLARNPGRRHAPYTQRLRRYARFLPLLIGDRHFGDSDEPSLQLRSVL